MNFDETPIDPAAPPKRKPVRGILTKGRSFGLAVFAQTTGRCAVVRRRYTFAFYDLLRGAYRPTYLEGILRSLTQNELDLVVMMASPRRGRGAEGSKRLRSGEGEGEGEDEDAGEVDGALLRAEGEKHIYNYGDYAFEQAAAMLSLSKKTVLGYSRRDDRDNLLEEWTLPKGHPRENETPFVCAVRECREELGGQTPDFTPGRPFTDVYVSLTNGAEYTTTFWPVLVADEFPLPFPAEAEEVSGRCWMSSGDASRVMRNHSHLSATKAAALLGVVW